MEAAAVALNVAVVAPAATVTEAGTVSAVLLLVSAIPQPPAGAAWVSVTVQVLAPLWPRLAGVQATPETSPGETPPPKNSPETTAFGPAVEVTSTFTCPVTFQTR